MNIRPIELQSTRCQHNYAAGSRGDIANLNTLAGCSYTAVVPVTRTEVMQVICYGTP